MNKVVLILACTLLMSTAEATSFDCGKAISATEKLICGNDNVSKLDDALHDAYLTELDQSLDKQKTRKEQRQWLRGVRNACDNAKCLKDAYQKRLSELESTSHVNTTASMAAPASDAPVTHETFLRIECNPKMGVISVDSRLRPDQLPSPAHAGQISPADLSAIEKRGYYSVQRSDVRDGCTIGNDTYNWFVMYHDQKERGECAAAEFWQFWFQIQKSDQFVYTLDGDMCVPNQPLLQSLRFKATPKGNSMTVCASADADSEPVCKTVQVQ